MTFLVALKFFCLLMKANSLGSFLTLLPPNLPPIIDHFVFFPVKFLSLENPQQTLSVIITVPGSIPGLGRSPREGNSYPFRMLAWSIPWTEEPGGL